MTYLSLIGTALLLGVYSTLSWRKLGYSLTSPAGGCLFLWSLIWLTHYLDFLEFYPVNDRALLYSFLPVIGIFAGEEIGKRLGASRRSRVFAWPRLRRILLGFSVMGVLFALASFISTWIIFGNPLEAGVGATIKAARSEAGIGILSGSPLYVLAKYMLISKGFLYASLFSLVGVWFIDRKTAIWMAGFCMLAAVLYDLSWGSRTTILDVLIIIVIFFAFGGSGIRIGRRAIVWASALVLGGGLLLGAQAITESTRPDRVGEVQGVEVPYAIEQFLVYYTSPLVLFDQTIDNNETRTLGLMSSGGILSLMSITRLYRNSNLTVYDVMYDWEIDNPNYSNGGYNRGNLYSWLRYFYTDFGVAGLFIVPLIIGMVAGKMMRSTALSSRYEFAGLTILVVCFYIVARSPIIFSLRDDFFVFAVCLLVGAVLISTKGKMTIR